MQDRVATYPGRVKLTPVAGQNNVYDLERADSPTVAGTPLNKASFLTDATAAAIAALGVSLPSLPTEALAALVNVFTNIGVNNVCHVETGSYVGTGTHSATTYVDLTFSITPKFVIIFSTEGSLGYPTTQTVMSWVEGQTVAGYTSGQASGDQRCEFVLNGKTLRRRLKNSYVGEGVLMNWSGTTYYYVGVGLK